MSSAARYRRTVNPSAPQEPPGTDGPAKLVPTDAVAQEEAELQEAVHDQAVKTSHGFSWLDMLRIAGGIALLSCGLSYLGTSGESMTWGYNGRWTRAREWRSLLQAPTALTDAQLAAYSGTDASKPIYLALNGTIYDVSASRSTYGPGGSYHFFAGRDAARAFVTGCFELDLVPDLRGVERTYLPVDPEEKLDASDEVKGMARGRRVLSAAEVKNRRAREMREAKRKVWEDLEGWHKLYRGDTGKPYRKVGVVKREEGWLEKMPVRELCDKAEKNRPVRKYED